MNTEFLVLQFHSFEDYKVLTIWGTLGDSGWGAE